MLPFFSRFNCSLKHQNHLKDRNQLPRHLSNVRLLQHHLYGSPLVWTQGVVYCGLLKIWLSHSPTHLYEVPNKLSYQIPINLKRKRIESNVVVVTITVVVKGSFILTPYYIMNNNKYYLPSLRLSIAQKLKDRKWLILLR